MKLGDELDFSNIRSELVTGSIVTINKKFVTVDFGSTHEVYEINRLNCVLENNIWVVRNFK